MTSLLNCAHSEQFRTGTLTQIEWQVLEDCLKLVLITYIILIIIFSEWGTFYERILDFFFKDENRNETEIQFLKKNPEKSI